MRISRAQVQQILHLYGKENRVGERGGTRSDSPRTDALNLSEDARQVSRWLERVRQLPDVRSDEVRRIRQALERGEYNPPVERVAEKMIERLLADRAVEELDSGA
ncbi:MAG TPA: flagellar biosynthesis anti-sigma factor FlgM [Bacillota bacterium]